MPIMSDDEMDLHRMTLHHMMQHHESPDLHRMSLHHRMQHHESPGLTPVKKLERSLKHSIDVESIPTSLKLKQSSSEGAVFLFKDLSNNDQSPNSDRPGNPKPNPKKSNIESSHNIWTSGLGLPLHSNGDSRRILEPPVTSLIRPPSGMPLSRKAFLQQQGLSEQMSSSTVSSSNSSPRKGVGSVMPPLQLLSHADSLDRTSSISSTWSSLDGHANAEELVDFNEAEARFLEANREYAESLLLDMVRRDQYPELTAQRQTYLDHANFALSSKFQTEEHTRVVMAEEHCLGANLASGPLRQHVSEVQTRLLHMFNTSKTKYSVVFTTSYRTAYRMLAQAYPFRKNSPVLVCQDNHECVRQVISAAVAAGGHPILAPLNDSDFCLTKPHITPLLSRRFFHPSGSLFVYPAQSSITGIHHSLSWVSKAHKSGWQVLLDASTLLPTQPLDLSHHLPDFVLGSFENMVGYPSSMGFLLVKRSSFCVSKTQNPTHDATISLTSKVPYWHGEDYHIVCEDESPPFLLFASLNFGLQHLESLGLATVNKRVKALSLWIVHNLKALRHEDEFWHLVNVYSPFTEENRGNVVSFNVLDGTGEHVKPALVKKVAAKYRIAVGVGTVAMNPGVANLLGPPGKRKKNLSVFFQQHRQQEEEFTCVQVSLGPVSNFEDAYRLVQFLMCFRDPEFVGTQSAKLKEEAGNNRRRSLRHP